jgi:chitin synthase
MGFVGFLTFGFTEATCPLPATTVHGNEVSPGYLIIKGWAYMLTDWQGHPPIKGVTNDSTNVLYPPINGAGMDASLLFPEHYSECDNVFIPLQGDQLNYFPCQLFNPNSTTAPDASQYTNRTSCHTASSATSELQQFNSQGVPMKNGKFQKRARVYYNYEDVNSTSHLMLYNGYVLWSNHNLKHTRMLILYIYIYLYL